MVVRLGFKLIFWERRKDILLRKVNKIVLEVLEIFYFFGESLDIVRR